jgi:hypothetical protein
MKRFSIFSFVCGCTSITAIHAGAISEPSPFTLDLSALGGSSMFAGATIASGLNYGYGMAVTSNGSLLFGQNVPLTPFGIEGGAVAGSVWILPMQAGGGYGTPQQVIGGLSGAVTDVRTMADGTILVDSGGGSGRQMTLYNSNYALLGTLGFTYPGSNSWWHSTGMSLATSTPQGDRIFFIVGSQNDTTKTTVQVSTSGLVSANLNADSVYVMTVKPNGVGSVDVVQQPTQVATGLRNPYGLSLDVNGNLIIGDNGQDGSHANGNELGADSLDIVPANAIGQTIYDFGFPASYTNFSTCQLVNGDPASVRSTAAFCLVNDAYGLDRSEGLAGMSYIPPGALSFVGPNGGEFIGFHGVTDAAGSANYDNATLYYDFARGQYYQIVHAGTAGVGHLDTVLMSGSSLFLLDMAMQGVVDGTGGAGSSNLYSFDLATPEPGAGSLLFAGLGIGMAILWRNNRRGKQRSGM